MVYAKVGQAASRARTLADPGRNSGSMDYRERESQPGLYRRDFQQGLDGGTAELSAGPECKQ